MTPARLLNKNLTIDLGLIARDVFDLNSNIELTLRCFWPPSKLISVYTNACLAIELNWNGLPNLLQCQKNLPADREFLESSGNRFLSSALHRQTTRPAASAWMRKSSVGFLVSTMIFSSGCGSPSGSKRRFAIKRSQREPILSVTVSLKRKISLGRCFVASESSMSCPCLSRRTVGLR